MPPAWQSTALNGISAYFTMFPLNFPLRILEKQAANGDWVLDPFCGRGTTNYAARIMGLPSVGIDSSPVATALSWAKLAHTTPDDIVAAATAILNDVPNIADVPTDEFWQWAYHPEVLVTLYRLRAGLLQDCSTDARRALRAIIMGGLHGPTGKIQKTYFSNQSQRTYAPKPRYAVNYWRKNDLKPPLVDVISIIRQRALRYYESESHAPTGYIVHGDSREQSSFAEIKPQSVRWVITSPPYYGMNTYVPDQWLRFWFVGGPAMPIYRNEHQLEHSNVDRFVTGLRQVWLNTGEVCQQNARLIIRFGALNDRHVSPMELISASLKETGWRILTKKSAGTAASGRRQAHSFANAPKDALEEFDIWAKWTG